MRPFANGDANHGWLEALDRVAEAMIEAHRTMLGHPGDLERADAFVRDRVCRCPQLPDRPAAPVLLWPFPSVRTHAQTRELLSGLGEAHSAFVSTLMLQRAGVQARFVDLSGWRDEGEVTLTNASLRAMEGVDPHPKSRS